MTRVSNRDMRGCVIRKQAFKNSNDTVYGEWKRVLNPDANEAKEIYVVFSYGSHFPMYIYVPELEVWFANADRYSVTTSRHQSQCHPGGNPVPLSCEAMRGVVSGQLKLNCNEVLYGMARAS